MRQAVDAIGVHLGRERAFTGTLLFMALRFGAATLLMAAIWPASLRAIERKMLPGAAILAVLLLAGFSLQMSGLAELSPSVSAFLTSLYVIFTAAITIVVQRRRPGLALVIGALLATLGAGVIRGRPELTFQTGEWLTIVAAVVFASHLLLTSHYTRNVRAIPFTLVNFGATAVLAVIAMIVLAQVPGQPTCDQLLDLVRDAAFLWPLMWMTTLATVGALLLMNVFQREIDPVRAAILYATEPIWATLVALAYGLDESTPWIWLGGALLVGGNLIADLGLARKTAALS